MEEWSEQSEMVHRNQQIGELVEELVKENLEDKGFTVNRTGIGSDFEITPDTGDSSTELKINKGNQNWLVEIKFTSIQEIKMTEKQAETSVEKREHFLLCVVQADTSELDGNSVKDRMKFVKNIGDLINPSYEELKKKKTVMNTSSTNSGEVKLRLEQGNARFIVNETVWKQRGFGIDILAEKLTEQKGA